MPETVLTARNLSYRYGEGAGDLTVRLSALTLERGQVRALTGTSGTGKSTLLECIGLIREGFFLGRDRGRPDGEFLLLGREIASLTKQERWQWRAAFLGYMPQTGGLLPFLSIKENIALQIDLSLKQRQSLGAGGERAPLQEASEGLSETLGIADLLNKKPAALSIGQRQRAVFLKAMAHQPALLLIDEPTSALDQDNAHHLFAAIKQAASGRGVAALIVTHDTALVDELGIERISLSPRSGRGLSLFEPVSATLGAA
ncbi:MAG: ABC transporter ATP-binding protein [Succinivibrio sp.]|nr:ABC transporter ATP-binding protein [Succinivibrio sp.]